VSRELLASKDIQIVSNLRSLTILPEPVRTSPDVADDSAAYVPILAGDRLASIIIFYGVPDDPAVVHHQKPFLRSVAAIIADTFEQADVRHSSRAQETIDELFRADALSDVLPRAAKVFATSTRAEGCIIAVRSEADTQVLQVVAAYGFHTQARECTFLNDAIAAVVLNDRLWSAYDSEIEPLLRRRLETLHGRPITACLGVPIASFGNPYGVILLINSAGRAPWFSRDDVELSKRLAHTIGRLIDKFRQIASTERSLLLARDNAERATIAQHNAETAALQRQEDIMVITHQLQAPLASVRASVLRLQRKFEQPQYQRHLEHILGLVEDSLALCWGTVTTFAAEAGRATSFEIRDIDAPAEMARLVNRMQKTNARDDLKFEFVADDSFPHIRIDRAAFTSVFYSLIHNAMKYADRHTRVVMECGFERATGSAVLKVKSIGEPIEPAEKERIFNKYRRGRVVTTTGRHHAGVGLGLWVAKQLIEAVGGEISVELNSMLPRLSVFIVRYPFVADGGAIA
jgi:signal transduction histidine kinase